MARIWPVPSPWPTVRSGVYAGTNTLTWTTGIAVESALDAVTSSIVIAGNGHAIVGSAGLTASIVTVASTGDLTLNETTVTGGKGVNGGAIYNQGNLTLTQSTLIGNTVSGRGGALFNNNGTVLLDQSTVADNSANSGGGLYNVGGGVTLTGSTVTGNRAQSGGGWGNGGTAVITYSEVSDNSAAYDGGGG